MRCRPALILVSFALALPAMANQPGSVAASDGWKLSSEGDGIKIYSRAHPNSPVKEFRAVGEIEAPSREVHAVIDDVASYPEFMPYVTQCLLLKRDEDSILTYQRISTKIVCDRDFTLRIREKSWASPDGLTFLNQWQIANGLGPPEKPGVIRVKICEGSWLLEPSSAVRTKATYSVCSDSAGKVPVFLANHFSQVSIRKIFEVVRKQVKDPKYATAE
jgi:Polyketide cyclase / dehydrase and lipid transport